MRHENPTPHRRVLTSIALVACLYPLSDVAAQVVRPVTHLAADVFEHTASALDDAGTAVYFRSSADRFGVNGRHAPQIVRCVLPAATCSAVSAFEDGVAGSISVSDDGQWLAFVSASDPLGSNHDESLELFVMRPDGTQLQQLTDAPGVWAGGVVDAQLAGSANRIAFLADTDPLGTNPDHRDQLYAIERDGTNLRQLTSHATGKTSGFSLSDDGERIVFGHAATASTEQIFAILADGTGLRLLVPDNDAFDPILAGGGSSVLYRSVDTSGSFPYEDELHLVNWDGSGARSIGVGFDPSIRDDAKFVYYSSSAADLWSVNTSSLETLNLTASAGPALNTEPVVSGNGNRIVFRAFAGEHAGGSNPDRGAELMALAPSGGGITQLTLNQADATDESPRITLDGTRVAFMSRRTFDEADAGNNREIFRVDADGANLEQVTELPGADSFHLAAAGDGNTLAFVSWGYINPPNPAGQAQLFRVFSDGTGLLQLTQPALPFSAKHPAISSDGSRVLFQSGGGHELYRVNPDGSDLTQVVYLDGYEPKLPRPTATGDWIVFQDAAAGPPMEVYRVRGDGTDLEQLTQGQTPCPHSTYCGSFHPDVSGDGAWIVYASDSDPLGTNPENNREIFLHETATGTVRQLTLTGEGNSTSPRISADGAFVYWISDAPIFESVAGNPTELYRVSVATGRIERAGGLRDARAVRNPLGEFDLSVDADGDRAVFARAANPTGDNPDLGSEVWLVDWSTPARIRVAKGAPTRVAWDPEPSPVRYDVIRGDAAQLRPGVNDSVDLGAVVCVEDDSPDADTAGDDDGLQPTPGQVLFYLYRGTQGAGDGPGSFGRGSGGAERLAGPGGCDP